MTLSVGEDKRVDFRLSAIAVSNPATQSVAPPVTKKETGFTHSMGMAFVYIEPGTFMMGSPTDEPERDDAEHQHRVTLTRGYYLQTTEVTVGQWRDFVRSTGYKSEGDAQKRVIS